MHQRGWVHSLRDIHTRKKTDPEDEGRSIWARQGNAGYDDAVAWVEQGPDPSHSARQQQPARVASHQAGEQRWWALCQPVAQTSAFPHTVCERMERLLPERGGSLSLVYLRTSIWPNAACARWSLLAPAVTARVPPKALRLA